MKSHLPGTTILSPRDVSALVLELPNSHLVLSLASDPTYQKAPEDSQTEAPGSLEACPLTHSKLSPSTKPWHQRGGGMLGVAGWVVEGKGMGRRWRVQS